MRYFSLATVKESIYLFINDFSATCHGSFMDYVVLYVCIKFTIADHQLKKVHYVVRVHLASVKGYRGWEVELTNDSDVLFDDGFPRRRNLAVTAAFCG